MALLYCLRIHTDTRIQKMEIEWTKQQQREEKNENKKNKKNVLTAFVVHEKSKKMETPKREIAQKSAK